MICDFERNEIVLEYEVNPHILILGSSGYGKTYLNIRLMEHLVRTGQTGIVLDAANSYSVSELKRNKCGIMRRIFYFDLKTDAYCHRIHCQNTEKSCEMIADSIITALKPYGFYQKDIIRRCCYDVFNANKQVFTFPSFISSLKQMSKIGETKEIRDNAHSIIFHLHDIEKINTFSISCTNKLVPAKCTIGIIQLSELSDQNATFLSEFLLSLIWKDAKLSNEGPYFDAVFLDEFQDLQFDKGSSLSRILKQGRKFGLQAVLSTQYISSFSPEQVNALHQAATMFCFHTTQKDMKQVASMIDEDNAVVWRKKLVRLKRGEAVLHGSYHIKGRSRTLTNPVLVRISALT